MCGLWLHHVPEYTLITVLLLGKETMAHPSEIRRGWLLIVSACMGVMFSSIVLPYYSIGAFVVPVTAEFGWTRAEFQTAILFSSGLGAFTAPVIGWLCDRYGSRRVALPGMVGLSIGFLIASRVDGALWTLYLAYAAMALLGAGTIPVTWTRAIATNFFQQRGLALGLALIGTGICGVLAPQYATWLVEHFGWRTAYVGLALLPVFVAGPVVLFGFKPNEKNAATTPTLNNDPQVTQGINLAQAARQKSFWILLFSILLVYMAVSGIGPNLYPAITDAGMSASEAASVLSVFGGAVMLGRLAVGYLVDRYWAPGVACVFMLLPVAGCWMLLDPANFWWSATATLLIGLAAGAELDLMSFFAAKYFGLLHYAQIYSVLYMALAVCSGTAPLLFASLYDYTASYNVSFTIAMGLFAAGAFIILALGKYPKEYA
jgi:MFS transporter, OFA family, oxalate/formate antiporter